MSDRETALKAQVRQFWNQQSCDTQVAVAAKFSREYFEQIEAFRYHDQPFIHSFAQFTRYRGKRVLEVGFGAGTDFIQWLRAGACVCGVDLTDEALRNLTSRIAAYDLPLPEQIVVADAEQLPFNTDSFDLGYSFGVLHHSPNTEKALAELIRVIRPGGELKIMLYNRHSIYVFNRWMQHGLLRGKPFTSLREILWNHMESIGTKGYTRAELSHLLSQLGVGEITIHTELTSADYLSGSAVPPLNLFFRLLIRAAGYSRAWYVSDYIERGQRAAATAQSARAQRPNVQFSGNRFGFFHCITAVKP